MIEQDGITACAFGTMKQCADFYAVRKGLYSLARHFGQIKPRVIGDATFQQTTVRCLGTILSAKLVETRTNALSTVFADSILARETHSCSPNRAPPLAVGTKLQVSADQS
jgi:hypothetical protein